MTEVWLERVAGLKAGAEDREQAIAVAAFTPLLSQVAGRPRL
ncbi:MAG TPA: hypothetical protein VKM94_17190 [Blastocatellia bacterium]|nr:hypothetical protein [Blastocatellia bacterium]